MNIFLSINRTERSVHIKEGIMRGIEKMTPDEATRIYYVRNPKIGGSSWEK